MTTLNTPMSFRPSRTLGLLGASLVMVLFAAGCSTSAPESPKAASATSTPAVSATPTPTAVAGLVDAPQSQAEAIAAGTAAMRTYLDVRAEIEVNHPADSSAIEAIAMGEAADKIHRIAATLTDQGTISSGSYAFDVTSAYANDLTASDGTVYPFGHAQLEGCMSAEGISATNADGIPVEMNPNRRGIVQVSVYYVAAESKWFLTSIESRDNAPC
ncbi:hypothetical protein C3B59_00880 [Cryobacterium zongtaii]|uniref:Lipoprotein n=2 Tax=Cryobacterium TaxID=69578 RepID=A0A2S3ZQ98_9MICO|nr:hypothetical protein [Cryobacterium zongtaii]POH71192.1 hypothetical protein C3B59_00880 [Cryobacterium zongtaii]